MSKISDIKYRLCTDPDTMFCWMDGGYLPVVSYESAEITGIQLSLMLDGHNEIYILAILPGDEYGTYDAWLRRVGGTDMIHVLTKLARDPEDAVLYALENLPDYLDIV